MGPPTLPAVQIRAEFAGGLGVMLPLSLGASHNPGPHCPAPPLRLSDWMGLSH